MRTKRVLAAAAASLIAATGLVACSSETESSTSNGDGDKVSVKIGTTDADLKAWSVFADEAQKAGRTPADLLAEFAKIKGAVVDDKTMLS